MKKKLQELLNAINAKKAEVINLVNEGKLDEAKAAKEELVNMQEEYDLLNDLGDAAPVNVLSGASPVEPVDAVHEFAEAARHGFYTNTMTEGTKADGGYTVPEDIRTKINKYKEAKAKLEDLVDVEPVSTASGRRTFQKKAQHTGFAAVSEGGKITAAKTPQFGILEYAIKKYAGYLPVTNELLADSDANITNCLVKWLGDEDIATRNAQILAALTASAPTDLKNLDGIKKAINVTLGSAYAGSVRIVTNDDGLNYLDTLKDGQNRYMLTPDAQNPMQMVLAVGARKIPVEVVPNDVLKTKTTKIPFKIGDFKEAVKIFDRQKLSVMTSSVAAVGELNAFEQDLTLFRGIERMDVKVKDKNAFVDGFIDTSVAG